MKKLVSIILCLALIFSFAAPTFAADNNWENVDDSGILMTNEIGSTETVFYSDGDVQLTSHVTSDGKIVLREYRDGVLAQRNTIYQGNNTFYEKEMFGQARIRSIERVYVSEYITTEMVATPQSMQRASTSSTLSGSIFYKAITTYDTIYYTARCSCTGAVLGQTTHTVNSYMGTVIDLASIIITTLALPAIFSKSVETLVLSVLADLGVNTIEGRIKTPFTDTFSCIETDYTWNIYDSEIGEVKNLTGAKYYINDVRSSLNGSTDYSGYTPNDWMSSKLSAIVHNSLYGYTNWVVQGWSALA